MTTHNVFAFPTETVYGIGCQVNDEESVKKIYALKERPLTKPLALLIADIEQVAIYAEKIPPLADTLMQKYWPGGLTIVLPASQSVSPLITSHSGKIGLRLPDDEPLRKFIRNQGGAIVGTSANKSGQKEITNPTELKHALGEDISLVIPPHAGGGTASTVVDLTGSKPQILRQGSVDISADI